MKKEDFFNAVRSEKESLTGKIKRVTFRSEETGFTVLRFVPDSDFEDQVTVVGVLPFISEGEHLRLYGDWKMNQKYGRQFQAETYEIILPVTKKGIEAYLASGVIKGIRKSTARKIIDKFGKEALQIIEKDPQRLLEIDGIGKNKLLRILQSWRDQNQARDVMIFLSQYGISPTMSAKIAKTYGTQTLDVIQKNPYKLADDVVGIGFLTADKIAQNMGISPEESARIESGLKYTLQKGLDEGHTYLPREELIAKSREILKVDQALIEAVLNELIRVNHLVPEEKKIYLPAFYHAEKRLAEKLALLTSVSFIKITEDETKRRVDQLAYVQGIQYTEEQKRAITLAMQEKVLVLTGGPGTGKTTTVRGIIRLFQAYKMAILLAAPTGRAAKRLSQATGRPALTIHRLLKFDPQNRNFYHNEKRPLKLDVLIVDEFSMVDTMLAYALVKALPVSAKLIIVGDVDQLPSVGAGNVLKDIIASGIVRVVHLSEVFRQAMNSKIIMNAHQINKGLMPDLDRKPGTAGPPANHKLRPIDDYGDFLFIQQEDPETSAKLILDMVTQKLPQRYGYDPLKDIEVLTPMYKGPVGVDRLNRLLQNALNPRRRELFRGEMEFAAGDKVMQIRNNYDRGVFNGDIGIIRGIDAESQTFRVDFGFTVKYDFSDIDELVLAYAITIHKSQGSEYPVVICPITTHHFIMLQRNLIYTAITRAKELVVLIGTRKALSIAIRNNRVQERYTGLKEFIRRASGKITN
ncbi:ATP-dependent RecD-like DNA helicase [bacterium BMS3Abin05]|nr:ATP-dependent RecD-like DNA helicase [bacterium BMS3Abin05]GBE27819.1 ATP-dependent RecD-like DNA helicase [bacterium BMS3Bbin03]HDZ12353.1 ATP-dependent RecD-like DNA helicase [Bacteroidota bacterium]